MKVCCKTWPCIYKLIRRVLRLLLGLLEMFGVYLGHNIHEEFETDIPGIIIQIKTLKLVTSFIFLERIVLKSSKTFQCDLSCLISSEAVERDKSKHNFVLNQIEEL